MELSASSGESECSDKDKELGPIKINYNKSMKKVTGVAGANGCHLIMLHADWCMGLEGPPGFGPKKEGQLNEVKVSLQGLLVHKNGTDEWYDSSIIDKTNNAKGKSRARGKKKSDNNNNNNNNNDNNNNKSEDVDLQEHMRTRLRLKRPRGVFTSISGKHSTIGPFLFTSLSKNHVFRFCMEYKGIKVFSCWFILVGNRSQEFDDENWTNERKERFQRTFKRIPEIEAEQAKEILQNRALEIEKKRDKERDKEKSLSDRETRVKERERNVFVQEARVTERERSVSVREKMVAKKETRVCDDLFEDISFSSLHLLVQEGFAFQEEEFAGQLSSVGTRKMQREDGENDVPSNTHSFVVNSLRGIEEKGVDHASSESESTKRQKQIDAAVFIKASSAEETFSEGDLVFVVMSENCWCAKKKLESNDNVIAVSVVADVDGTLEATTPYAIFHPDGQDATVPVVLIGVVPVRGGHVENGKVFVGDVEVGTLFTNPCVSAPEGFVMAMVDNLYVAMLANKKGHRHYINFMTRKTAEVMKLGKAAAGFGALNQLEGFKDTLLTTTCSRDMRLWNERFEDSVTEMFWSGFLNYKKSVCDHLIQDGGVDALTVQFYELFTRPFVPINGLNAFV